MVIDRPDVLVPSSELALYAIAILLPGLLLLPVKGLWFEAGDAFLPCFAAARKLRCTCTCTVASAWGTADTAALAGDASGGLAGPSASAAGLRGAALSKVLADS